MQVAELLSPYPHRTVGGSGAPKLAGPRRRPATSPPSNLAPRPDWLPLATASHPVARFPDLLEDDHRHRFRRPYQGRKRQYSILPSPGQEFSSRLLRRSQTGCNLNKNNQIENSTLPGPRKPREEVNKLLSSGFPPPVRVFLESEFGEIHLLPLHGGRGCSERFLLSRQHPPCAGRPPGRPGVERERPLPRPGGDPGRGPWR